MDALYVNITVNKFKIRPSVAVSKYLNRNPGDSIAKMQGQVVA